jgi:hypothetical protein
MRRRGRRCARRTRCRARGEGRRPRTLGRPHWRAQSSTYPTRTARAGLKRLTRSSGAGWRGGGRTARGAALNGNPGAPRIGCGQLRGSGRPRAAARRRRALRAAPRRRGAWPRAKPRAGGPAAGAMILYNKVGRLGGGAVAGPGRRAAPAQCAAPCGRPSHAARLSRRGLHPTLPPSRSAAPHPPAGLVGPAADHARLWCAGAATGRGGGRRRRLGRASFGPAARTRHRRQQRRRPAAHDPPTP